MKRFGFFVLLFFAVCCCTSLADFFPEDDEPFPQHRDRIRRFVQFRVRSRKPGPDAEDEFGIGLPGHVMNVLKGGTFGVDFKLKHVDRFGKRFTDVWNTFSKNTPDEKEIDDGKDLDNEIDEGEKEGRAMDYGSLINPRNQIRADRIIEV